MIFDKWTIVYNPAPIPVRDFDYEAVHEDYDGDNGLCFYACSIEEAIEIIKGGVN